VAAIGGNRGVRVAAVVEALQEEDNVGDGVVGCQNNLTSRRRQEGRREGKEGVVHHSRKDALHHGSYDVE